MLSPIYAQAILCAALVLSATSAHAEDSGDNTPANVRGWKRKPQKDKVLVLPPTGRALGTVASGVVWLVVAPLRGTLYLEDRYKVSEKVEDVLYNDARTAGIIPTTSFASGFGLTIGAKAFHNNMFGGDESLSLSGKYGGEFTQAAQLKLEVPGIAGSGFYIRSRARYEKRGNALFQGIGNGSGETGMNIDPRSAEIETRFDQERFLGVVSAGTAIGPVTRELRLGLSVIHNDREFSAIDDWQPYTSLEQVYDTSALVGYEGFSLTEITADLEFDLLDKPQATRAFHLRSFVGGTPIGDYNFVHYGGQLSVEQTLFYSERVLILRLAHEGVAGRRDDIPFTELPRLGGAGLLRGYRSNQFRDKLSAIATVEYHYPIHANIGGVMFLEAGSVAQEYSELQGLESDWHMGIGGGLFYKTPSGVKARIDVAQGDALQVYLSTDVLEAFSSRLKEL